jgi:hypothetical protein
MNLKKKKKKFQKICSAKSTVIEKKSEVVFSIVTILTRTTGEGDVISLDLCVCAYARRQGHLPCWKYEGSTNRGDEKRKREKKKEKKKKTKICYEQHRRRRKNIY